MNIPDGPTVLPPAKRTIADHILSVLTPIDGIRSVTFVGSFVDRDDLSSISDIDTIVIFEFLTPAVFSAAVQAVAALTGEMVGFPGRSVVVNTNLGPLKSNLRDHIVVHLMLYDLASHRNHTLMSPFTCFDWERSSVVVGARLADLYPVGGLAPGDFTAARRGLENYLADLETGRLSYRRLQAAGDRIVEVPDSIVLDRWHQGEYAYHIIRNLIVNALKMRTRGNRFWDESTLHLDWAREFADLAGWIPYYDHLRDVKMRKSNAFPADTLPKVREFIQAFSSSLDRTIGNSLRVRFVRHAPTLMNDGTFLGRGRDPALADAGSIKPLSESWDFVHSSPLRRAFETTSALVPGMAVRTENRLTEIDYGHAEGLTSNQIRERYPETAAGWARGVDSAFPGGESTEDVRSRLRAYLASVASFSGRGLVVTHNVVLRVLVVDLLGLDLRYAYRIQIPHLDSLDVCCIDGRWLPDWGRTIKARLIDDIMEWNAHAS